LRIKVLSTVLAVAFIAAGAASAGHHNHHLDGQGGPHGIGVLNAVDTENGKVNISHGPIPALKWPKMTMDMPVTENVDLDKFGKGNKVQFTVELNDARVYQITVMCATDKDEVTEDLCEEHQAMGEHHDRGGHANSHE